MQCWDISEARIPGGHPSKALGQSKNLGHYRTLLKQTPSFHNYIRLVRVTSVLHLVKIKTLQKHIKHVYNQKCIKNVDKDTHGGVNKDVDLRISDLVLKNTICIVAYTYFKLSTCHRYSPLIWKLLELC